MKIFLAVAALIVSTVMTAEAQGQIDNPEYKMWSGFKAGAFVKFKMVSEASGNKSETEQTVKLVEITPAKAVVEMTIVAMGNKLPPQKRDIPAKITPQPVKDAKTQAVKAAEGDEDIDVGGKKVKAHWTESTVDMSGNKTTSRVWQAKTVPGGTVKMESRTTGGMTSKTTMVATEWKD
jgi:hypothetical protein